MPKQGFKQSKLDPKILAKWWQDAEEQIKLAHPYESKKNQQKLTEKYVQSQIEKSTKREHPDPSEKQIADWYRNELIRLRLELPDTPLKQRESIAASIVINKMKRYQRTIRLDTFFESNEED
jgi:hypothetical protein